MNKKRIHSLLPIVMGVAFFGLLAQVSLYAQTPETVSNIQDASTAALDHTELQKSEPSTTQSALVKKTYELKYINSQEFFMSAEDFLNYLSGRSEYSVTFTIEAAKIPALEALIKKLDVEKKTIQFQVYAIAASRETPSNYRENSFIMDIGKIEDKGLRQVLGEMQSLWNFKYYQVESPSFVLVKEGPGAVGGGGFLKLVSRYELNMNISGVNLRGDEPGKRIISSQKIQLNFTPYGTEKLTLIDAHDITFKEDGYLVVGVSGFRAAGPGGAMILVIHAIIK